MEQKKKERVRPARDRVIACLEKFTGQQKSPATPLLPSVSAIARECGISRTTAHLVISRWRKGAGKEGESSVSPTGIRPEEKIPYQWERVYERIRGDIVKFVYPPGSRLPPAKMLVARYEAGYGCIRKALNRLISEEKVERAARGYTVIDRRVSAVSATLVFVYPGKNMPVFTDRFSHLFREFEKECCRKRIRLVTLPFGSDDSENVMSTLETSTFIVGYLLYMMLLTDIQKSAFADRILHSKKPVILVDEFGDFSLRWPENMNMRHYLLGAGSGAGYAMGRYLVGLGHRKIAFFTRAQKSSWGFARSRGVESAFAESGIGNGIRKYILEGFDSPRMARRTINRIPFNRCIFENTNRCFSRHKPAFIPRQALLELHVPTLMSEYLFHSMTAMFDDALSDSSVTAWLFLTDQLATVGLSYLHKHRIAVPRRLSVAGFDNSNEAFLHQLTSYDFNIEAIIASAFDFLLDTRWNKKRGITIIEVPGMVVPRTTTAMPRPFAVHDGSK